MRGSQKEKEREKKIYFAIINRLRNKMSLIDYLVKFLYLRVKRIFFFYVESILFIL